MARILILHPGEMGAAVGAALVDVGHDVLWIPNGRSADTRSRAERAGLVPTGDPTDCDLVISVCPPSAALGVAASVALGASAPGFGSPEVDGPGSKKDSRAGVTAGGPATGEDADGVRGAVRSTADRASAAPQPPETPVEAPSAPAVPAPAIRASVVESPAASGRIYLDANAIAPSTAATIAVGVTNAGMRYLDGGIVGPPPIRAGTTRLYLSGADAAAVAEAFRGARIEPRVIDDAGDTAASALKMAYAAWSKISAALLIGVDAAADRTGIRDALRAEWALSQPELAHRLDLALASASAKGWRWEAEMREIAVAFDRVGLPTGYGRAAAETFSGFDRPRPDGGRST